ncbi:hypothetical protein [Rhodopirellula sp. SWK7]|uniref:hypothetical protein n=1 Tax=Rhodopirellula sp. SWK7 TaxID=595460 RepID=UPI0002BD7943|nr:hypothetical protein [Rhodopirellula sp. SWK7]EMI41110.1 membrane protein [Rhodopirellula sp. SWK7]
MFHTRDLLATTAVIALTIAIANASVAYRGTGLPTLALATPLLLTALVHWRFALDWRVATGLHYPLAILWAFGFGVAFSIAWRRVPKTFFERDSVGLDYPLQFGMFSMEVMAIAGIASTAAYGLVSYCIHRFRITRTSTTTGNNAVHRSGVSASSDG